MADTSPPALEEPASAPAAAPSGPPPLEGGPLPLEEPASAPSPPGLATKAKPAAAASAPPPLEPPPLALEPAAASSAPEPPPPLEPVAEAPAAPESASGPPPLEPAAESASGPPPLESAPGSASGPPPLEPAPAPTAIASGSGPPPLASPPAPAPVPAAGPAIASKPSAPPLPTAAPADVAAPEDIRQGIVDYLKKKPGNKDQMPRLGMYLRSRKLTPDGQLKRFIQTYCQGRVVVESKAGTDFVQLAEAAAAEKSAAVRAAAAAAAVATPSPQPTEAPKRPGSAAATDNFDPIWLEQELMRFCVQQQRAGVQPTMPTLGSFCIDKLGLQMKGRLKPFLERRPQLCSLSDDGRQHVNLTPAGILLGGGTLPSTPSTAAAAAPAGPGPAAAAGAAHPAAASAPLAGLAAGKLPGSSGGGPAGAASASTDQVAAAVMPGVAAAQSAAKDYKKWDPITKEIFQFVRSKGVATFTQIDTHIKTTNPKLITATGIPLHQWKSQYFLHKRRNIFRLQGPVVSLSSYIPEAAEDPASTTPAPVAGTSAEEFPPLPGTATSTNAPAPADGRAGSGTSTSVSNGSIAAAAAGAAAAAAAAENPLLVAFASERQMLEQLRDDVQSKLASFKALSELQKENSGLRAACVTLGRELLSLKTEFMAFQQQTVSALAAISPPAANMLMSGMAAGMQAVQQAQQQRVQQQQGLSPAGTPTAAQAEAEAEAAAMAVPALPAHMPAALPAVPQAAAAAEPSLPLPRGEIVLVGGHDGGSWLDSVDYFSPKESVWASLPLLGNPRSFSAAVGTASEVFVAGGGNGVEWFDSVVRYDRHAGLMGGWVELAPLQVARGSLAAAMASGYLFVYGGGKPKEQYDVVEWYDLQNNRWLSGPRLQRKRFAVGGASLDGSLYAVGGFDGSSYLECAERLDPRTDRWELLPGTMSSKRGGHAVTAASGCLYALGGFNSVQAMPHCEVYELRMNSWRPIADMADSRAYGSCAVLGDTVFAVGGLQSDMQTHAILIERYNPANDSWMHVELPPNANPRRSFLAACGLE